MTDADYPHIFKSGRIGRVELGRRAVTAPMTRVSAGPGGVPTDQMRDYYRAYAEGGFALIVTEGTYPDRRYAQGYLNQPGITDAAQHDGWAKVVEAVHGAGARIFQQLMHAGALSQHSDFADETVGPSAVQPAGEMSKTYFGDGRYRVPRALDIDGIEEVKAGFADAAKRSVSAGFDGIEIHGANGYLLHQFFSTTANQRDDRYGGSAENRARLHGEVVPAIKEAVGPDIPVGMRLSQVAVNDLSNLWDDGPGDARALFSAVATAGADYLHINGVPALKPVFDGDRTLAAHARDYYDGPIVACGALSDPAAAEQVLAQGDADFIAMARGALAEPAWPNKIAAGETPQPFDPGMTQPVATLDAVAAWRAANG